MPGEGDEGLRRRDGGRGRDLQETTEPVDVEHLHGQGLVAGLLEARAAVALGQTDEGVDLPHACPGQVSLEELLGEAADGGSVLGCFAREVSDVPQGIGGLLGGKVAWVRGAFAGGAGRGGPDGGGGGLETHGGGGGPGPQGLFPPSGGAGGESPWPPG